MLTVKDFDYELPQNLIAQTPLEPRDSSRLLVVDRRTDTIENRIFHDILEYLQPGDLLVANNTKVIPARLLGKREDTGGKVEVFLLHRHSQQVWEALVKPGKKMRPGQKAWFGEKLCCEVQEDTDYGGRLVRFTYDGVFEELLEELGETPLPPYIHAKLDEPGRYQTVYARERGSAAAPTAGLHFTPELMSQVRSRGAEFAFVTLNIGLGTFRPVRMERIEDHVMHREYYNVPKETARQVNRTRELGGRIIAVGTTAVRTLETAAEGGLLQAGGGWSEVFIYPGHSFQLVDALITNFHLPQSTLLMLVSALAGREKIFAAYREAVRLQYRFFSFGDAMFIK